MRAWKWQSMDGFSLLSYLYGDDIKYDRMMCKLFCVIQTIFKTKEILASLFFFDNHPTEFFFPKLAHTMHGYPIADDHPIIHSSSPLIQCYKKTLPQEKEIHPKLNKSHTLDYDPKVGRIHLPK